MSEVIVTIVAAVTMAVLALIAAVTVKIIEKLFP
jgi:hypothetical protein